MTNYLKQCALFLGILYLLCLMLQNAIDEGLRKSSWSHFKEWNDILDSRINADLIIQGSSRAFVQLSPAAMDTTLHLNSYNLGMDGYEFPMQYTRYQLYRQTNRKPRFIIQSVDAYLLGDQNSGKPNLYEHWQFLPYLDQALIRKACSNYHGAFTFVDYTFPLFKYHNSLMAVGAGFSSFLLGKELQNDTYKGFKANDYAWDESFSKFKSRHPLGITIEPDLQSENLFEQFLANCHKDTIQVILVYTPEYIEAQDMVLNRSAFTDRFRRYADKYQFPFLDYSSDSICQSTDNFYNSQHLNATGVNKFNKKLVSDLKSLLHR